MKRAGHVWSVPIHFQHEQTDGLHETHGDLRSGRTTAGRSRRGGGREILPVHLVSWKWRERLHLAISHDGDTWRPLNDNQPFLKPDVGGKLMRDPCLAQGPDGRFHMVWTTSWTAEHGRVFGYSTTTNLIDWTPQRAIEVMQQEPTARNIWAPEIFYDDREQHWLVLWSSTIPGRFPDTDETGDDGYNHRIYYTTTRDFETFTESRLFYDPGFNVIDATLMQVGDQYHLFIKDETPASRQKTYPAHCRSIAHGPVRSPVRSDHARLGGRSVRNSDRWGIPGVLGSLRPTSILRRSSIAGSPDLGRLHR
jgi:hypothetical protein